MFKKIFRKINETGPIKIFQRGREAQHEDYAREHKGLTECPKCHNVRFKKKWFKSLKVVQNSSKKELNITRKEKCPACKTIEENLFAGELFIESFPEKYQTELLSLIHNFGKRALEIDPQDRLIKIEETEKGYRVLTTDNQLADRLAKKIKEAWKGTKIQLVYSQEPYKVDRVWATYHEN